MEAWTYENPVQRGFFPDPSVIRVGEDYYMVNSSFQYFPAIPISHSRDMVHWEIVGHAITNPDWLDLSEIKDSHGIWAPDISYCNGKYYIFATLRLNGDGDAPVKVLRRQLVVTADRPEGPYSRPSWLEVDSIDPSHFVDDDGKQYMIIAPGIKIVPLDETGTKAAGEMVNAWEGTGERCPEGPHILKKDSWYYAILAEGGTGYGHGINVGRSESLFGPYESSPYNPVLRQTDSRAPLQRTGHGKLVQAADGSWWCFYLLGRPNAHKYTTVGRESGLDPVQWTPDGWFTVNNGKGPGMVQTGPDLEPCVYPKWTRDDFDNPVLNRNWEFVRRPAYGDFSLTERPGYCRIWTGDGQLFEIRAKNTLLRREQELSYEAWTKLEFQPELPGEQAGLTCYYSTATYVRLSLCFQGSRKLQLVVNRGRGEEVAAETADIKEGPVYLKVVTNRLKRSFYYSYDGTDWQTVGVLEECIYLCDEGVPGDPKRHTGTLVGIYANNGGTGSRKPADFDFFEYN